MIITPIDDFVLSLHLPPDFTPSYPSQPRLTRSPGLHVSSILRALAQKIGKLTPDDLDTDVGDEGLSLDAQLRVALGLSFEDWLAPRVDVWMRSQYASRYSYVYHDGEFEQDGIFGTPDAVYHWFASPGNSGQGLDEYKLTWTSSNTPPEDRWLWLKQTMAYLTMFWPNGGANVARWFVYHVNGNYGKGGGPRGPQMRAWRLEFKQAELDANWEMILANRQLGTVEV